MATKLTLSIDAVVVEKAKSFLQGKNQSLSGLVEDYFQLLIKTGQHKKDRASLGCIKKIAIDFQCCKNKSVYSRSCTCIWFHNICFIPHCFCQVETACIIVLNSDLRCHQFFPKHTSAILE